MKKLYNFTLLSSLLAGSLCGFPLKATIGSLLQSLQKIGQNKVTTLEVGLKNDDNGGSYVISSRLLRSRPFFELYNEQYFNGNSVSSHELIQFRKRTNENVKTSVLSELLEGLGQEIKAGHKEFTDFIVLTSSTFNWSLCAGALVLKFKNYPFVAKIFIETPYSMTHPFNKGFEDYALFRMGGGISRHLAGFTRIANREYILQKREAKNLADQFSLPRKWFWKPEVENNLIIKGINFHQQRGALEIKIPTVYAVIADAIESERTFSLFKSSDRQIAFDLYNALGNCIDPNPNNFLVEQGTGDVVLIDTEHWPSLIGVTIKPNISNYASYYAFFGALHCIRNFIFGMRNKKGKPFIVHTKLLKKPLD